MGEDVGRGWGKKGKNGMNGGGRRGRVGWRLGLRVSKERGSASVAETRKARRKNNWSPSQGGTLSTMDSVVN